MCAMGGTQCIITTITIGYMLPRRAHSPLRTLAEFALGCQPAQFGHKEATTQRNPLTAIKRHICRPRPHQMQGTVPGQNRAILRNMLLPQSLADTNILLDKCGADWYYMAILSRSNW